MTDLFGILGRALDPQILAKERTNAVITAMLKPRQCDGMNSQSDTVRIEATSSRSKKRMLNGASTVAARKTSPREHSVSKTEPSGR